MADQWEVTDFTWKIKNFEMLGKDYGEAIESPMFSAGNNTHSVWYLKLYPKGLQGTNRVLCDVIRLRGSFTGRFTFTISLVMTDGRIEQECASTTNRCVFMWPINNNVSSDTLKFNSDRFNKDLQPQDTLTLKCQLKFESPPSQYEFGLEALSENIGCLCENKEFSDLTLYTKDRDFFVHQSILCQRAPEFLSDVGFEYSNVNNNRVEVNCMSTSALTYFLQYLYTGIFCELPSEEIIIELSKISEKYKFVEFGELIHTSYLPLTVETQVSVVRKHIKWNIPAVNINLDDTISFYKCFILGKINFLISLSSDGKWRNKIFIQCTSVLEIDTILDCQISCRFSNYFRNKDGHVRMKLLTTGNKKQKLLSFEPHYGNIEVFLNLALSVCQEFSTVDGMVLSSPDTPKIFGMGLLRHHLATMFEDSQKTERKEDVTLLFGDKKIRANQAILFAWSPIFSSMFQHDMEEKNNNRVCITDVDYNTAVRLIGYMYSGNVNRQSFATDSLLYAAADKYQVSSLFKTCSEFLLSELSIENACHVLQLADMHSDKDLLNSALRYIKADQEQIFNSSGWKTLLVANPKLASFVIKANPEHE